MPTFFETANFLVKAFDQPHHSRENGGHIIIAPKIDVTDRTKLSLPLAEELMYLTMIVGEATTTALTYLGTEIVRINYQDNGNWAYKNDPPSPHLHIHLYLRTYGEKHPNNHPKFQPFPDALVFPPRESGYYDEFKPLNENECSKIKEEIVKLLNSEKYKDTGIEF